MLISALLILLLPFLFLVFSFGKRNNKHLFLISIYFISCSALLVVSTLYTATVSNYNSGIALDMNLLFFFRQKPLHVVTLSRLYNLSVALFMLSATISVLVIKKRAKLQLFSLLAIITLFLYLNDPNTTSDVFILQYTGNNKPLINIIYNNLGIINNIIVCLYLGFPLYCINQRIRNTKIQFMVKNYRILSICMIIIDIYFMLILNVFFKTIRYSNIDLAKLPIERPDSYIATMPIFITFLLIFSVIFILLYFKPFDNLIIKPRYSVANNMKNTSNNLNMILHTYKNAFITVDRIASTINDCLANGNDDTIKSCTKTLNIISTDQLDKINKTLFLTRIKDFTSTKVNIADTINLAVNESKIPENIKVTVTSESPIINVLGEHFYLKEVFKNLIENSITALEQTDKEEKIIEIKSYTDDEFVIIEVFDNGCGIYNKSKNEIFDLYSSSKPKKECGGIGLYFVHNIISLLNGEIEVSSTVNEYTLFLIILPRYDK